MQTIITERPFSKPFLSSARCAELETRVKSLRSYWTPVGGALHTLGKPSYVFPVHTAVSAAENALIWEHFAGLLRQVRIWFRDELAMTVYFSNKLRLPGFHIFQSSGGFYRNQVGDFHQDKVAENYSAFLHLKPSNAITATIILSLPSTGGGLEYRSEEMTYFLPYRPGNIVLFRSAVRHRIAPFCLLSDRDYRLTFQIHLATQDNRFWLAFW